MADSQPQWRQAPEWGFVFRAFVGAVLFAAWLSEVAFALVAGYRVLSAMGKSQHVLETKLTHQL